VGKKSYQIIKCIAHSSRIVDDMCYYTQLNNIVLCIPCETIVTSKHSITVGQHRIAILQQKKIKTA